MFHVVQDVEQFTQRQWSRLSQWNATAAVDLRGGVQVGTQAESASVLCEARPTAHPLDSTVTWHGSKTFWNIAKNVFHK